ncbi:MAG: glycosyltransferase [Thaumarchaeota archaeon]|nr:glycosyltransferase [Nitrososphaerota archaeon]
MRSTKGVSVVVVSGAVGKSPDHVQVSFIFDEIYRLSLGGMDVHVVSPTFEPTTKSFGMTFHSLGRRVQSIAMRAMVENAHTYPAFSLLRNPARLYWESLYAATASSVLIETRAQIIHAHFAYPEGLVATLARNHVKARLVVTVHGYDIISDPSIGYGARLDRRVDAITREVLRGADAILTASNAAYEEVLRIVSDREKVRLIPNGVDLRRFSPSLGVQDAKSKLGIESPRMVFSLRHHEPKYGLEYLIRAIPMVVAKAKDVVFVIGGDGPLRDFHEGLVATLGVRDRVIFTGRIAQELVPLYYSASDIVVVPSVQEVFGLTVTEAMACGKPVVASNVGGIVDQVADGVTGFTIPPKDPGAIAERILWLLENEQRARDMGAKGRSVAERRFDIEERIRRILSLYKALIE